MKSLFTSNGPGDLSSIPGRVKPKTWKMVLDTFLLNTQQYKVHIRGKVEQSRERSSALRLHLSVVAIGKGAFWSLSTMVVNFTYLDEIKSFRWHVEQEFWSDHKMQTQEQILFMLSNLIPTN